MATPPAEPLRQVTAWLAAAQEAGEPLPEAMTLATSTADGTPSARLVILRGIDRGLLFFTDAESDKGAELAANPRAAAVLHWHRPEHRQVRVAGEVEPGSDIEADGYWRSRPPGARRTATAVHQSRVVDGHATLESRIAELRDEQPDDTDLPRPARWRGFRIIPRSVEFWQEAADGLHGRIRYLRDDGGWTSERLEP